MNISHCYRFNIWTELYEINYNSYYIILDSVELTEDTKKTLKMLDYFKLE